MGDRAAVRDEREALAAALRASSSEMSIVSRGVFDEEEEDESEGDGDGAAPVSRRPSVCQEVAASVAGPEVDAEAKRKLGAELLDALYLGTSNFFLAYNTRAGIAVVLRALKLAQRRQFAKAVDLRELLGEKNLAFRVDAVRLGLFLGWFTGGYRGLRALLPHVLRRLFALHRKFCQQMSGKKPDASKPKESPESSARIEQLSSLLAGALAGAAIVAFDGKRRRSMALYALTRALQCAYNMAKQKQYWHFWGSDWQYGDALLFALSSAQVMYAYVMRPGTLPPEYFRFIQNTGPVELETLELVQQANRGQLINQNTLQGLIARKNIDIEGLVLPRGPGDLVPCRLVHCDARSCAHGAALCFRDAFVRTFPLYLSLFIVPGVVIHFKKFVRSPFRSLARYVLNATRSNTFLASFVTVYLYSICLHRRLVTTDHRIAYYITGLVASTTILLEPKSRRSELALYVLPRAIDSLAMILRDRKIFSGFRHGEVALFSGSMAVMMYCYQHEKEAVSPFLYSTMRRFLQTSTDKMEQHFATLEQQRKVQEEKALAVERA